MTEQLLGGLAALLLLASAGLWMLRPRTRGAVEGGMAPDFASQDQDGLIRRLGDYAGRWLVLYFYPRDGTPICTREACRFRDDIDLLGEFGATVVGISVNSVASQRPVNADARPPSLD